MPFAYFVSKTVVLILINSIEYYQYQQLQQLVFTEPLLSARHISVFSLFRFKAIFSDEYYLGIINPRDEQTKTTEGLSTKLPKIIHTADKWQNYDCKLRQLTTKSLHLLITTLCCLSLRLSPKNIKFNHIIANIYKKLSLGK